MGADRQEGTVAPGRVAAGDDGVGVVIAIAHIGIGISDGAAVGHDHPVAAAIVTIIADVVVAIKVEHGIAAVHNERIVCDGRRVIGVTVADIGIAVAGGTRSKVGRLEGVITADIEVADNIGPGTAGNDQSHNGEVHEQRTQKARVAQGDSQRRRFQIHVFAAWKVGKKINT